MLGRFAGLSRRFAQERGGNFAMLVSLCAVPLLFVVGGVIDLTIAQSRRAAIQSAVDSAALAAAKQYAADPDPAVLAHVAQQFFAANTGTLHRTKATLVFDGLALTQSHAREVRLHADYAYDPIFIPKALAGLAGFGERTAEVRSAVLVSDTTVEIAMVLDTSGSMGDAPAAGGPPKIATLRTEALGLVGRFFEGAATGAAKPTQVAIVPFAGAVNVGPQHIDEAWMDPKGLSKAHNETFDWTTYTDLWGRPMAQRNADGSFSLASDPRTRLTRQYLYRTAREANVETDRTSCLYKGMSYPGCTWTGSGRNWTMKLGPVPICQTSRDEMCQPIRITYGAPLFSPKGCVETRVGAPGLTDAAPDPSRPETLFVPWFSPDEPDWNGDPRDSGVNDYLLDRFSKDAFGRSPLAGAGFAGLQENMNKYLLLPKVSSSASPNDLCDSDPILPLQSQLAPVKAAIERLNAKGSTNVEEGVAWGWRVLSSGAPFTEGRASGDPKNVKAIILMTDGENTYYEAANPNRSLYGSHGFSSEEHIFDDSGRPKTHSSANFTLSMEARTRKVCENAKNDGRRPLLDAAGRQVTDSKGAVTIDGVQIYTIAFDIPASIAPRIKQVLTDCASYRAADLRDTALPYAAKSKYYYPVADAAGLKAAFAEIMASLTKMRISE